MGLTTANWITILIAIIGPIIAFAASWGANQVQQARLNEKVAELKQEMAELKASRESNGRRLGKIENDYNLLYYIVTRGKTLASGVRVRRTLTPAKEGEEET